MNESLPKPEPCSLCGQSREPTFRSIFDGWICCHREMCLERQQAAAESDIQAGGLGMTLEEASAAYPDHRVELAEVALSRWTFAKGQKLLFTRSEPGDQLRGHPLAQQFPLDNRGPKVCALCGTFEGALLSTHRADWLCANIEACERRLKVKDAREALAIDKHRERIASLEETNAALNDRLLRIDSLCETGMHTFTWRNGHGPCRLCGEPSIVELPDYEALGYPETGVLWTYADMENVMADPHVFYVAIGYRARVLDWRPEKDYP